MTKLETVLVKVHLGRYQAEEMLKEVRLGHPLGPDLTQVEVEELLTSNIDIFDRLIEKLDRFETVKDGETSALEQAKEQFEREYASAD